MSQLYSGNYVWARGKVRGCEKDVFRNTMVTEKGWNWGGMQIRRGGLWVCNSAWCEKGKMRRLCKNALRGGGVVKE